MKTLWATFRWPIVVTVIGIAVSGILGGPHVMAIVAILAVLEISLSFDNAVVNATILQKMNPAWQKLFLTVGVLIAVFGMRLIFPLAVVGITAHLSPYKVIDLAINQPDTYARHLTDAHAEIAAFGGLFLLMIFLDFLFEEREIAWLAPIERLTAKLGRVDGLSIVVAGISLLVAAKTLVDDHEESSVLVAGLLGLLTYVAVGGLSDLFETDSEDEEEGAEGSGLGQAVLASGRAAFFLFLYLEVLDASFSFDGVVGAFAISSDIFVIATGLGIGAMYIRSLTVYLVQQGTLSEYRHLEHGAHYAIGALAVLLLLTMKYDVPEVVTGLIGVGFIGIALVTSIAARNRDRESGDLVTV